MKLTIPRSEFIAALSAVKTAAARNGSQPILANVLLAAAENSLTITATDLDLYLRITTEATIEAEGQTTVRACLLHDLIRATDGPDVQLKVDGHSLIVDGGTAHHKLATLSAGEFPRWPMIRDGKNQAEFTLEDASFRSLLSETVYAVSADESRVVLCGSLIRVGKGRLEVVGCDGRRCAVVRSECPVEPTTSLNVPSKTVRELLRHLGNNPDKPQRLTVKTSGNLVQFSFGSLVILSKLIEGSYPPFEQILPKEEVLAVLPRAELLRRLERIALVADNVALKFGRSVLELESFGKRGEEVLGEASDRLDLPANREARVTLNCKLLRDTLTAIDDEHLQVHLQGEKVFMVKSANRDWRAVIAALVLPTATAPAKP